MRALYPSLFVLLVFTLFTLTQAQPIEERPSETEWQEDEDTETDLEKRIWPFNRKKKIRQKDYFKLPTDKTQRCDADYASTMINGTLYLFDRSIGALDRLYHGQAQRSNDTDMAVIKGAMDYWGVMPLTSGDMVSVDPANRGDLSNVIEYYNDARDMLLSKTITLICDEPTGNGWTTLNGCSKETLNGEADYDKREIHICVANIRKRYKYASLADAIAASPDLEAGTTVDELKTPSGTLLHELLHFVHPLWDDVDIEDCDEPPYLVDQTYKNSKGRNVVANSADRCHALVVNRGAKAARLNPENYSVFGNVAAVAPVADYGAGTKSVGWK